MARNRKKLTMKTICTSARAVARYLISRQGDEGMNAYTLTNMRLQKILYFAQGFALGSMGIPLFDDPFHALPYGPVCLDIYGMLKQYRGGPIPISEGDGNLKSLESSIDARVFLQAVMEWANAFDTSELVRRSHIENGPWARSWSPASAHYARPYNEIPQCEIRDYFARFFQS